MRRALEGLEGVEKAKVSYSNKQAWVAYDPGKVKPREMVKAVKKAGYSAIPRPGR